MTASIWPRDTFFGPKLPRFDEGEYFKVRCFVATPFSPKKKWDSLFALISDTARDVGMPNGIVIECIRADQITSAGVVHPEIWGQLREADFLIFDVTGSNGNVMMELGVAAGWRRKEHVLILRDKADDRPAVFDINPARRIEYETSYEGILKLRAQLSALIFELIGGFPSEDDFPQEVGLPFRAALDEGVDERALVTPDIAHRRMVEGYLEFGSPLHYRYGWMTLGDLTLDRVRVKASMRITLGGSELTSNIGENSPFVGVMVRGHSFFSNFGHMAFVRPDGNVYLTNKSPGDRTSDDIKVADSEFDVGEFVEFDVWIGDSELSIGVRQGNMEVDERVRLSDLNYVFSAGRVVFIAGLCRAGIKGVEVEALDNG